MIVPAIVLFFQSWDVSAGLERETDTRWENEEEAPSRGER